VVIDLRNAYESCIGHFDPPKDGATLLDPQLRNSNEFPSWLNSKETQAKLNGKRIMMYCTGGIRCERATALLNELTATEPSFKTKGVFELRGGVERYMKTFPGGGVWKGKNYVFDRRQIQVPEMKSEEALKSDIDSKCSVCRIPWDIYRGKHKCTQFGCGVPVLVCTTCISNLDSENPTSLLCELCRIGYAAPKDKPDWGKMREKREAAAKAATAYAGKDTRRIFVGKLPLIVDATKIKSALNAAGGDMELLDWIRDKKSGAFYGSAFVQMATVAEAKQVVEKANDSGVKLEGTKKRLKLRLAPLRDGEKWPPANHEPRERPPIC